jgi:hypothetical protein
MEEEKDKNEERKNVRRKMRIWKGKGGRKEYKSEDEMKKI